MKKSHQFFNFVNHGNWQLCLYRYFIFKFKRAFISEPREKVEVYYFHFTRRCTTCTKVENESRKALETLYPEQVKKGEITFQSVNLDEKDGEAIGAKYKIEGQTLIVISGDKRVDLTDKGFLYASNSPDKLKTEIKKAVDGMLK